MKTRNSRRLTFEVLEDRQLLAADVFATQPIADVRQLAAMFAPQKVSESEVRIDLAQKGLSLSSDDNLADLKSAQKKYFGVKDDQLLVSVMGKATSVELLPAMKAAGVCFASVGR